ncbi:hypothetical protein M514_12953 [Trichuris suis]|uniref:Uncharacterized protein n=1 Tax=Trichuris suis TaxID=68888 RepID=A0A085N542_9BILA|nr:hypothetical protein M513_12953 [Trichuris suis]KFD64588.1 hypothetical protein M514_12953 [Trichuris suis]
MHESPNFTVKFELFGFHSIRLGEQPYPGPRLSDVDSVIAVRGEPPEMHHVLTHNLPLSYIREVGESAHRRSHVCGTKA